MTSRGIVLGLVAAALGAVLGTVATQGGASGDMTPMTISVRETTVGSPTVARASLQDAGSCPYGACRTTPAAGTTVWRLVSARRPEVRFRHRSVVHDTRPASDSTTSLRVTRP